MCSLKSYFSTNLNNITNVSFFFCFYLYYNTMHLDNIGTEMELNVGGYQIGKTNGCLDYSVINVWTADDAKNAKEGKGVGMCCRSQW